MIPGIPMQLGDGKTYTIPPLTLGSLEDLQDRIDAVSGMDKASIATMIDVALAALRRNYPDLTREEVGGLIDVANMDEVFTSALDASGLKRKALEAEAAEAQGAPEGNAPTESE
ncbi:hypothetical protein [Novosphingobium sp. EMRT-2]|uniref:hypothetical protein n=1 Tax=Novosphingobium sp. EMRT-2 TaxID=2571749 RepID=UPI0010BDA972|nr:hypothetical protein [Novosphingobium sp. EMRT-2]QCI93373.1 hypothetical protein FA702_07270 [Novosphingobium sp. EMRT-2]